MNQLVYAFGMLGHEGNDDFLKDLTDEVRILKEKGCTMSTWAVVCENGVWFARGRDEHGTLTFESPCPSMEQAIELVSLATCGPVGIELITRKV